MWLPASRGWQNLIHQLTTLFEQPAFAHSSSQPLRTARGQLIDYVRYKPQSSQEGCLPLV